MQVELKLLIANLPDNMPISVMGAEVQTAVVLDNVLILDENPDSFGETGLVLYQAIQQNRPIKGDGVLRRRRNKPQTH